MISLKHVLTVVTCLCLVVQIRHVVCVCKTRCAGVIKYFLVAAQYIWWNVSLYQVCLALVKEPSCVCFRIVWGVYQVCCPHCKALKEMFGNCKTADETHARVCYMHQILSQSNLVRLLVMTTHCPGRTRLDIWIGMCISCSPKCNRSDLHAV